MHQERIVEASKIVINVNHESEGTLTSYDLLKKFFPWLSNQVKNHLISANPSEPLPKLPLYFARCCANDPKKDSASFDAFINILAKEKASTRIIQLFIDEYYGHQESTNSVVRTSEMKMWHEIPGIKKPTVPDSSSSSSSSSSSLSSTPSTLKSR
jgi:hypothetical protein